MCISKCYAIQLKCRKGGRGKKPPKKKKKKTHSLIGMLAKNHHLQKSLKKKRVGIKKEIRKIHVAKQKGEECKEAGRKHRPERERRDEKKKHNQAFSLSTTSPSSFFGLPAITLGSNPSPSPCSSPPPPSSFSSSSSPLPSPFPLPLPTSRR